MILDYASCRRSVAVARIAAEERAVWKDEAHDVRVERVRGAHPVK